MTDRIWNKSLAVLQGQMTQASYDYLLAGSQLEQVNGHYVVHATSSQAKDNLEARWLDKVSSAVSQAAGQDVKIVFDSKPYYLPEVGAEAEPVQNPDMDVIGAYLDKRNTIIQPEKVMVFTQYFRKEWWKLLKPVESLLVMELRQRCYSPTGRNSCQATYADLAECINVSRDTILRLLKRDKDGQFKSEYLGQFIKSIETIQRSNGKGEIRNIGSKFVIVLDDPLTPKDAKELS